VKLPDVNVLVHAARTDSPLHDTCFTWLMQTLASSETLGLTPTVLAGVIRVATHPRIFVNRTSTDEIVLFCETIVSHSSTTLLGTSVRQWSLFATLCKEHQIRGNLVTDALLAAIALDLDAEVVSLDRDFARFPSLRWLNPAA